MLKFTDLCSFIMYCTPLYKEVIIIQLSERQREIVDIVRRLAPVTGDKIAETLGLTRPTLRSDLALLVMLGLVDAKPKVGYLPGHHPKYDSHIGNMLKKLTVADILSEPILISGDTTAYDAVLMLFQQNTGTLMVTGEEQELIGIVTRKDLLKVMLGHTDLHTVPVTMAMTRRAQMTTLAPKDTLLEAISRLIRHQVNCLPVLDEQCSSSTSIRELVGRVTKTDIMNAILSLTEETT
ncbi:CBS domain-containing protein [Paenibacillus polymyxa]|uniref:CBS domain-containing protein n=1 Tax=Paenibacillus polymyxa TaxID=1406 RepID=UPI002378A034|nr:CBS domain-containing protein [Paenibacillus polymyxa]WDM23732.1 CBS domain-containing protein [Paenibacillus polymyxa]